MADDVPAGWYPTPTGGHRYWDGTKWTSLPWDGDDESTSASLPSDGRGEAKPAPKERRKLVRGIVIGAAALLVLAGTAGGIGLKLDSDARAAAIVAAQEKSDKEEAEAQAAADAQERADEAERAGRTAAVSNIEASVEKMAKGHAKSGAIKGPIIDVSCSPVGGGSTDDLTEQTTVFECFVANKKNSDGTMSGYYYNATMNWDSGEYTYGLGRA